MNAFVNNCSRASCTGSACAAISITQYGLRQRRPASIPALAEIQTYRGLAWTDSCSADAHDATTENRSATASVALTRLTMISVPPIPPAAQQLARFRSDRLREAVQHIGPSAASFRSEVDAAIAQHDPLCIQSVTQAFVASYRTFSESLEAARAHRSMDASTADVLTRILNQLKNEYAEGLTGMRADIARLQACDASLFKAFCSTANDKIDRLEQFWKTAYPHLSAPKADGMESGI